MTIDTNNKHILHLKDYSIDYLSSLFRITKIDIPEDLRCKEVFKDNKSFSLECFGYEIENWGHLHCTIMESKGLENFNLIIFPNNDQLIPIFTSEILFFGNKPYLVVIDIKFLENKNKQILIDKKLDLIKNKYSHLGSVEELSNWAKKNLSKKAFYVKPQMKDLTAMINVYKDYFCLFSEIVKQENLSNLQTAYDKSNEYKKDHSEDYPGLEYFIKIFGRDWSKRYFNNFMYKTR